MNPIVEALKQLDPTNDEHWTTEGLPRIDAVQAVSGKAYSRAEITAAIPGFSRANLDPAEPAPPAPPAPAEPAQNNETAKAEPAPVKEGEELEGEELAKARLNEARVALDAAKRKFQGAQDELDKFVVARERTESDVHRQAQTIAAYQKAQREAREKQAQARSAATQLLSENKF